MNVRTSSPLLPSDALLLEDMVPYLTDGYRWRPGQRTITTEELLSLAANLFDVHLALLRKYGVTVELEER